MNKLVEEVRVNKNGVPVKKYVRADGKGSRQPSPLPPPESANRDPHFLHCKKLSSLIQDELSEGEYEHTNVSMPANITAYLVKQYSRETIAAYVKASEESPDDLYPALLLGVLSNRDDDHKAAYMLALAKVDNQKDYEWDDASKGPYTYMTASQIYYGLHSDEYKHNVEFVPTDNILDDSDPETQQVLALVKFTNRLYERYDEAGDLAMDDAEKGQMIRIDNEGLVKLILERPHDEERISSVVLDGQISHADVIRAQLDAPVQSLRDGAL